MSKKPFSDKRWNDHSLKGVTFDNSHVTLTQKEKTRKFHKLFKETFAKKLKDKYSEK